MAINRVGRRGLVAPCHFVLRKDIYELEQFFREFLPVEVCNEIKLFADSADRLCKRIDLYPTIFFKENNPVYYFANIFIFKIN